ncbi:gsl3275 [Gloeobacter violaceus PCC 7421]|uniref:Gsl3275 protein n=1 Tax=Gloeobacter violaceus (strain ATCC 29082 / PCC 7421) TaxID=251221 RepID=Q7NG98_GLOVI|nr:gsl3275 [Gloeobacter violaceus PCC 7421]
MAHLQLHMALQARKLLPSALDTSNHCHNLLYQSQAEYEKFISRHRP